MLNEQDSGRTQYAHMAFDEVSGPNSTALPYGGDEFARLVNRYETDEFVHMIQNVECDITGHYDEIGETGKTLVYENDISKHTPTFTFKAPIEVLNVKVTVF
jgi:hypothetical protein